MRAIISKSEEQGSLGYVVGRLYETSDGRGVYLCIDAAAPTLISLTIATPEPFKLWNTVAQWLRPFQGTITLSNE